MAALAVTNNFTAGTSIVASQMNTNFSDVVTWATGSPNLSTAGQTTTVSGALTVTQATTLSSTLGVTGLATFSDDVFLAGSNQRLVYEGSAADAHETFIAATNPTADRTITFPDATGTVALTSDITSPTWNDANNILTNSVFN
jgi:hypothetical protein